MGLWGVIGKALNSTVKTSDCVPLNEIVQECANEVIDACEAKAPVSITTVSKSGSTSSSGVAMFNVTGKGYIDIVISASATDNTITRAIDGVTLLSKKDIRSLPMIDIDNYSVPLKMRFNKSAKLLVYDSSTSVKGIIVFEE